MLECSDGRYYVGSTADLAVRLAHHASGRGCAFTARRLPVRLVYSEPLATLAEAVRRERQLKGWSRAKKTALITGEFNLVRRLARRRRSSPSRPSP